MLIYGLDSKDTKEFCRLYAQSSIEKDGEVTRGTSPLSVALQRSVARREGVSSAGRRGRKLILEDHVQTIRDMVAKNPGTTTRDVELRLRSNGVSFANNSAITNLARNYDIALAA